MGGGGGEGEGRAQGRERLVQPLLHLERVAHHTLLVLSDLRP